MSRKNMGDMAKLVAELLVSDFAQSLKFYTEALGFRQLYDRPEEAFAYLDRNGVQIMIVQHEAGDERSWIAGELTQPFGRGMNLEIEVEDVEALHASCVRHGARVFLDMEEKWYRRDALLLGVRQFIVLDPDGYLLRLSQSLGTRAYQESRGMDDQGIGLAREALKQIQLFWCLDDTDIEVKRLGGLTNLVFYVSLNGEQYVLRIPGKGTEEYINRKNEAQAAREAAKAGVSPDVLYFEETTGVMVTRFIDHGVTMSPENFKSREGSPRRAGEAFKKLHTSGAKFNFRFELFAMIDDYLKILATKDISLPDGYAEVVKDAESVRWALAAHKLPLAACHCDPLCENFLDTGKRMWIVDWEYSGMNDPLWDLGDLAVEGQFNTAQEEEMIAAYFDGAPTPAERGRFVIYKAMCDLLWTLWGLIQHANKNPVDDFWAYSINRFERCKKLMATPEFPVHVKAVADGSKK